MSGDELREREQRIMLETSSQSGTGADGDISGSKVPTISGSKATLNDIRYRGSGKGIDDNLSSKLNLRYWSYFGSRRGVYGIDKTI